MSVPLSQDPFKVEEEKESKDSFASAHEPVHTCNATSLSLNLGCALCLCNETRVGAALRESEFVAATETEMLSFFSSVILTTIPIPGSLSPTVCNIV